jgi:hypothetical protein
LEGLDDEAARAWEKASDMLGRNPLIEDRVPDLNALLNHLVESSHSKKAESQEPKSFFSRFSEMARFEEEVAADIPVAARIEEIILDYVFLDE